MTRPRCTHAPWTTCEECGVQWMSECEHGIKFDDECLACDALYETWRDERDYAI
jgi:hypothetical protein